MCCCCCRRRRKKKQVVVAGAQTTTAEAAPPNGTLATVKPTIQASDQKATDKVNDDKKTKEGSKMTGTKAEDRKGVVNEADQKHDEVPSPFRFPDVDEQLSSTARRGTRKASIQVKVTSGFYQPISNADDTLEKLKSLEEEKSDAMEASLSKKNRNVKE